MQESPIERLLRALLNLGAELRTLSFAVTTPPVPEWYQPEPRAPKPKGSAKFKEWEDNYEIQRMLDWPEYWLELRIARISQQRQAKAGRLSL